MMNWVIWSFGYLVIDLTIEGLGALRIGGRFRGSEISAGGADGSREDRPQFDGLLFQRQDRFARQ